MFRKINRFSRTKFGTFLLVILILFISVTQTLIQIHEAQASVLALFTDAVLAGIVTLLIACGCTFVNANDARAAASAFYSYCGLSSAPGWAQGLCLYVVGQAFDVTSDLWSHAQDFIHNYLLPVIVSGSDVVTITGTASNVPITTTPDVIQSGFVSTCDISTPIAFSNPNGITTGMSTPIYIMSLPVMMICGTQFTETINFSFNGTSMYYMATNPSGNIYGLNMQGVYTALSSVMFTYANNSFTSNIEVKLTSDGLAKLYMNGTYLTLLSTGTGTNLWGSTGMSIKSGTIPAGYSLSTNISTSSTLPVGTGTTYDPTVTAPPATSVPVQSVSAVGGITPAQLDALTGAINTGTAVDTSILTQVTSISTAITAITAVPASTDILDFSKLSLDATLFTNRFPFSLPWDIQRMLTSFGSGSTAAPSFNIYLFPTVQASCNLSMWNDLASSVRFIELFAFNIGLVFGTRKLLGGDV